MKDLYIKIHNGGDEAVAAVQEYLADRGQMVDRVSEVFAKQTWISVNKELPPTDEPVLACWSRQKIGMGCAMFRNLFGKHCWTPADQWEECDEPIAWMPLPEPPEAE